MGPWQVPVSTPIRNASLIVNPPPYSYVAYIDESGDPGLNAVAPRTAGGSSEWIIVAAALIPAELESEIGPWVGQLMRLMNSHQMWDTTPTPSNTKPTMTPNKPQTE